MAYAKSDPSCTTSKLRDCIRLGDFNYENWKAKLKMGLKQKGKVISDSYYS